MILAAGLGTRLRPLTDKTPKPLLPVNGLPLILHQIRYLKRFGISTILINLHHLGSMIKKALGDGSQEGVKISYSDEKSILGTGGGIKKAEIFFGSQPFIVINSDNLIDCNLNDLIAFHKTKGGIATMVLRLKGPTSQESSVTVDQNLRIVTIKKNDQTSNKNATETMMYTGLQIVSPSLLRYIPAGRSACLIEDGYQPALKAGEKIYGFPHHGYWCDLGTIERYREAQATP